MALATVNRRRFLEAGIGIGLGLCVGGSASLPQGQRGIAGLGADDFLSRLGGSFRIELGEGRQAVLRLTRVISLANHRAGGPWPGESYRLHFALLGGGSLEQGTYRLSAAGWGSFPIFLVPASGPAGRSQVVATVNRKLA